MSSCLKDVFLAFAIAYQNQNRYNKIIIKNKEVEAMNVAQLQTEILKLKQEKDVCILVRYNTQLT